MTKQNETSLPERPVKNTEIDPEIMRKLEEPDPTKVEHAIKKENSKAIRRFIPGLILCCILGGIGGGLISYFSHNGAVSPAEAITEMLFVITPFMLPVIFILFGLIVLVYDRRARALQKTWDGEDEQVANEMERSISKAMLTTSIGSIVSLFFLGIQIYFVITTSHTSPDTGDLLQRILFMIGFVALPFFFALVQKRLVDYLKKLHPEKKGSVFDLKFADQWLESCDEAERMSIYRSAYAAYKFMNAFLIALWTVTMFIAIGFGTGLLAMTMITVAWLAMTIVYSLHAMKEGK